MNTDDGSSATIDRQSISKNTGSRIRSDADNHSTANRPLVTVDDLQELYDKLNRGEFNTK